MLRSTVVRVIGLVGSCLLISEGGEARVTATVGGLDRVCVERHVEERGGESRATQLRIPEEVLRRFREVGCDGIRGSVSRSTAHMCQIAQLNNRQLEADFLQHHGVTPRELCEMAE